MSKIRMNPRLLPTDMSLLPVSSTWSQASSTRANHRPTRLLLPSSSFKMKFLLEMPSNKMANLPAVMTRSITLQCHVNTTRVCNMPTPCHSCSTSLSPQWAWVTQQASAALRTMPCPSWTPSARSKAQLPPWCRWWMLIFTTSPTMKEVTPMRATLFWEEEACPAAPNWSARRNSLEQQSSSRTLTAWLDSHPWRNRLKTWPRASPKQTRTCTMAKKYSPRDRCIPLLVNRVVLWQK